MGWATLKNIGINIFNFVRYDYMTIVLIIFIISIILLSIYILKYIREYHMT